MSTWGTTPGKWLCRITLRKDGNKLSYSEALGRSFNVWIRGLGIGIPLVSMVTQIVSYNKLVTNGKTTWDQEGNYDVVHEKIGFWRTLFMIVFFLGYYALTYYGK